MSETYQFALLMLLTAAAGLFALLSNRLTERIKVPAPLVLLFSRMFSRMSAVVPGTASAGVLAEAVTEMPLPPSIGFCQ